MNNQKTLMKKQFLLAAVIVTAAFSALGNNVSAIAVTHESTGSLSTSGSVSVVVT